MELQNEEIHIANFKSEFDFLVILVFLVLHLNGPIGPSFDH